MSRTLLLLAVTLLGCAPQSIDAVSCESGRCAAGGAGFSGSAGTSGSTGIGGAGAFGVGTAALIHRYSFDATPDGVEVVDSVRGRNGSLVGGAVYGEREAAGTVLLAGKDSNQYVDLPNHLLAGLKDVTFEAWVVWAGGDPWQRIFDFGEDDTGVDGSRSGEPRSYAFFACIPRPRFAFRPPPVKSQEILMTGAAPFPTGSLTHVAVAIDETAQSASLFVNGLEAASTRFSGTLSDVYDVNNWLGRSQFIADAGFEGSFSEFRIYERALSGSELAASFAAGPDASVP
ncbi:MAG TPA: LamG domain-containing protein [Polyangiaceae bacterium]|nr:LamG domain-containing protein [Polyangiaceae bacterium]